jgi:hypothetical protein
VNILNKQSQTADTGQPSSLRVDWGLTTLHRKKQSLSQNVTYRLGPGWILWHDLSIDLGEIGWGRVVEWIQLAQGGNGGGLL